MVFLLLLLLLLWLRLLARLPCTLSASRPSSAPAHRWRVLHWRVSIHPRSEVVARTAEASCVATGAHRRRIRRAEAGIASMGISEGRDGGKRRESGGEFEEEDVSPCGDESDGEDEDADEGKEDEGDEEDAEEGGGGPRGKECGGLCASALLYTHLTQNLLVRTSKGSIISVAGSTGSSGGGGGECLDTGAW